MPDLPSGTVTFLFTDIEGSTRLWEEQPDAMRVALVGHDALMRRCITAHGGYVFKTIGDAFCTVFATASDAVAAALEAQCALIELASSSLPLRVRMALHTGATEERDNDYFGPPVNRVARLLSIVHGGQILLSEVTQELLHGKLPTAASLRSLGEHRLRDLIHPEHVFQLLHPDLPDDFTALRSLGNPALPNNLPQQLTSFIGREDRLAEVGRLLSTTRLLTLTGAGGCGKTRLALHVAADMLSAYSDGAWLVELAPVTDPAQAPQAVASAMGLKEQAGRPLTQTLVDFLKPKTLLLVLDNCEHLLPACAHMVHPLLRACPNLRLLVTSRHALDIEGELIYQVPPLSVPDPRRLPPIERIGQYEAVRLFSERAALKQAGFILNHQNARAVAQICWRVDGIPLAIELAAARLNLLSVEEIARFNNYFQLLTGGSRSSPPRQQTLTATLTWSYDLLSDAEQDLLRRLAVFTGGWTLEAAEEVCSGEGIESWEVLDLLAGLIGSSLIVVEVQEGATRYRMLETVRQYAGSRLEASGKTESVRNRHLDYFVDLAERAAARLIGVEQATWVRRLESEHDNLRSALAWAVEGEHRLRLAGALWRFWYMRGYLSEGLSWLENTLARRANASATLRAKALTGAGVLAWAKAEYAAAQTYLQEGLHIRRSMQDTRGIAEILANLGTVLRTVGDLAQARTYYDESLDLCRELGNRSNIVAALNNLGMVALDLGDAEIAACHFRECLATARETDDRANMTNALTNLAAACYWLGDYPASCAYAEEAAALYQASGDAVNLPMALINRGASLSKLGQHVRARQILRECLSLWFEMGNRQGSIEALTDLAYALCEGGEYRRAAVLLGAGIFLNAQIGVVQGPDERRRHVHYMAQLQQFLGDAELESALDTGRGMSLEEAVAYAREGDINP